MRIEKFLIASICLLATGLGEAGAKIEHWTTQTGWQKPCGRAAGLIKDRHEQKQTGEQWNATLLTSPFLPP